MNNSSKLIVVTIALFIAAFTVVIPERNIVNHDNNIKLKWKDFQGTPDPNVNARAISYVGFQMGYKGTARQDSLIIVVEAFFDRTTSWHNGDTTAYILSHEQTHFDITELYSRKLKQSIQGATLTYKNYQPVLRELEKNALKAMNTADSIYDLATDFSRLNDKQAEWNTNIQKDLANMVVFAADTFKVPVKF